MIKQINDFTPDLIEKLAEIWLTENLAAHDFVGEKYWLDNLEYFKQEISNANVWISQTTDEISGFIGLTDNYIQGIFVLDQYQNQGIGKQLLNQAKGINKTLELHVYQQNEKAIEFYLGQGFQKIRSEINVSTQEKELTMSWSRA